MSVQGKEAKSTHTTRMIWNAGDNPVSMQEEQTTKTVSKWRILVVENDSETRKDHVHNLERWGYQVFAAAAQEAPKQTLLDNAREVAKRERCQLALVDMRLLSDDDDSDISGLYLVPELKPTESIVVTGYADRPIYARQANERGVLAVFGKEEGPKILQKAVEDALTRFGDPYPEPETLAKYRTSHPWRALVVDDDLQERSYYVDFLNSLGYQVYEATCKDAAQKAKEHRCHLALVDADANASINLDDIKKLKPAETIIIGRSPAFETLRESVPESIPTIQKRAGAEKLGERIQTVLKDSGYREIGIKWPDELNAIRVARHIFRDNPELFEEEAKDVLRRLFKSANSLRVVLLDPDKNTPSVTLKPRSLVVRVQQDDHLRSYFVKVGRESKTKREMENYEGVSGFFTANPYIRPYITFRFWNVGGTVYDFAGDYDDLDFKLFSEYYLIKEEAGDIREALDSHLKLWSDLYHRRTKDKTISEAYDEVWGIGWHKALKCHYDRIWGAQQHSGTQSCVDLAFPGISTSLNLQNPVKWLIDRLFDPDGNYRDSKTPETRVAKTHGDFHADNFFVTKDHYVCPIDFERAGDGPVLQDWIELEHDILTRLLFSQPNTWRQMQPKEWRLFARLVCVVAQPKGVEAFARDDDDTRLRERMGEPHIDKALNVIDRIRILARQSDEKASKDARAYIWGLLLNATYRLVNWCEEYDEDRLNEESSEEYEIRRQKLSQGVQRCYVLAGILCHRLDNWDADEWLPMEWQAILTPPKPGSVTIGSETSVPAEADPAQPISQKPTQSAKNLTILHLSDIHLGTREQAEVYYAQLETDLIHGFSLKKLDYLVISGDIADKATENDYASAQLLIDRILRKFKLQRGHVIIVPGNHDVSYVQSKQVYSKFVIGQVPPAGIKQRFIPRGIGRSVCEDERAYEERLGYFAQFYATICGQSYPLASENQATLAVFPSHQLLFLGMNTAHEIDHHYEHRASIHMVALANGLQKVTSRYDGWLKVALWHHPISGERAMNDEFMELLTRRGFQICMHGHIHEAIEDYHRYDSRRGIQVIGAGTFGSPVGQQTAGIPLQYNLISLDPAACTARVETRKKEKPNGAWSADPRWEDKDNPRPYHDFDVKWGLCISDRTAKR